MDFRISKRHGAGNDFLVQLTQEMDLAITPAIARELCDRHFGVGADGFLIGLVDPSRVNAVNMVLYNADGSRAEMSGNGIRTLAHAVFDWARLLNQSVWESTPFQIEVGTDVGLKVVDITPTDDPRTVYGAVAMGTGRILGALGPGVEVDMGNPHLVIVLGDSDPLPSFSEVETLGAAMQSLREGGINVEWISRRSTDPTTFDLVVYERGVGPTLACGTGSSASFLVARELAMTGDRATIVNPGGALGLQWKAGSLVLEGPSHFICHVDIDV